MLGENKATPGTSLSNFRTLGIKRRETTVSEKGVKKSTMKESESKTASNDIKAAKH